MAASGLERRASGWQGGLRIAGAWQDLTDPERRLLTCFRLRGLADHAGPDPASRAALALAGLAGEAAVLEVLLQILRRHGRRPFRLARPLAAFVTTDERDLLDMLALAELDGGRGPVRGPGRLWPLLDPQGGRLAARVLTELGRALAAAGLVLPQPALPDVEPTWMPPLADGRAGAGAFHLVR